MSGNDYEYYCRAPFELEPGETLEETVRNHLLWVWREHSRQSHEAWYEAVRREDNRVEDGEEWDEVRHQRDQDENTNQFIDREEVNLGSDEYWEQFRLSHSGIEVPLEVEREVLKLAIEEAHGNRDRDYYNRPQPEVEPDNMAWAVKIVVETVSGRADGLVQERRERQEAEERERAEMKRRLAEAKARRQAAER